MIIIYFYYDIFYLLILLIIILIDYPFNEVDHLNCIDVFEGLQRSGGPAALHSRLPIRHVSQCRSEDIGLQLFGGLRPGMQQIRHLPQLAIGPSLSNRMLRRNGYTFSTISNVVFFSFVGFFVNLLFKFVNSQEFIFQLKSQQFWPYKKNTTKLQFWLINILITKFWHYKLK